MIRVLITVLFPLAMAMGNNLKGDLKYNIMLGQTASAVCGIDGVTYNSKSEAQAAGTVVAHCGACGACSNVEDIPLIQEKGLTAKVIQCSLNGIIWGNGETRRCLQKEIGFSPACTKCFTDQIMCTRKNCASICAIEKVMNIVKLPSEVMNILNPHLQQNSQGQTDLDPSQCLECDKEHCTAEFRACVGATRWKLGVVSDIPPRGDEDELCDEMDDISAYLQLGR